MYYMGCNKTMKNNKQDSVKNKNEIPKINNVILKENE